MKQRLIISGLALLLACDADSVPPAAASEQTVGGEDQRRAELRSLRPIDTRAGHPRFTGAILKDALAAEVFAGRLADASVAADERVALAEALPRCGGAWADVVLARLAIEQDVSVRVVLIAGLARADEGEALAGARVGLRDPEARVRRAGAELAGWVPGVGKALAAELQAALADSTVEVRAAAARAIGLTGDVAAFDAVARGLGDSDAQVRLESVRAIHRIDGERAASLPAMATLQKDSDLRVQRAARGE